MSKFCSSLNAFLVNCAAMEEEKKILIRRRGQVSAAARGLTTGAAVTLALLASFTDNGKSILSAVAVVFAGALQMILGEVLGGTLDGTAWQRTVSICIQVSLFLAFGLIPVAAAVVPRVGGAAAVLVVVTLQIAVLAIAHKQSTAAILVILGCGCVLAIDFLMYRRLN